MSTDIQQRYNASVREFQRYLEELEAQDRKNAQKGLLTRLFARFTKRREQQMEKIKENQRRRAYEIRKNI